MGDSNEIPYDRLTKSSFDALAWPSLIQDVEVKECREYAKPFAEKAKALADQGQRDQAQAARVLMEIACLGFVPAESDNPFHPRMVWDGKRTTVPSDFPPSLIAIIRSLAEEAVDPEFASRLGDVALTRMERKTSGLVDFTVRNYLQSGKSLYQRDQWGAGYLRFRRAVHLCQRPSPELQSVVQAAFDRFLAEDSSKAPLLETVQMLELYRDALEGDPKALAAKASELAQMAAEAKSWHLCRRLHKLTAYWLKAARNDTEAKRALYDAAETYVHLAAEAMARPTPSPLVAADELLRSAKAHREIDKSSERAAELDRLRAQYQQRGIQQVEWVNLADEPGADALRRSIAAAEDALQAAALNAIRAARGLGLYEAIRLLALCHAPPNTKRMEETATQQLQECVFGSIIPMTLSDEEGRPFAKAGSFLHADDKGRRLIVEQRMLESFRRFHIPETVAIFEAIREQIQSSFQILPEHVEPIVANSPFIPKAREYLFARGLHAGLIGDFCIAGHLLAPQVEHAFKLHLASHGVIPTVIESEETERLADLNYLFRNKRKEIEDLCGRDEAFEFEALLIRRWGCHLRNYIAHGQLHPWQFYEHPVRYLWWLTLRYCMFGLSPIPRSSAGKEQSVAEFNSLPDEKPREVST